MADAHAVINNLLERIASLEYENAVLKAEQTASNQVEAAEAGETLEA